MRSPEGESCSVKNEFYQADTQCREVDTSRGLRWALQQNCCQDRGGNESFYWFSVNSELPLREMDFDG
jgi:hypothetical protein